MTDILVTKADVLAAGFCASGMREWCRLHGFTAAEVREGIPIEKMEAIDCALGRQVIAAARARHANNKTV